MKVKPKMSCLTSFRVIVYMPTIIFKEPEIAKTQQNLLHFLASLPITLLSAVFLHSLHRSSLRLGSHGALLYFLSRICDLVSLHPCPQPAIPSKALNCLRILANTTARILVLSNLLSARVLLNPRTISILKSLQI